MKKPFLLSAILFILAFTVSAQNADSVKGTKMATANVDSLSNKNPLVVIDNKKQTFRGTSGLASLDINSIESVTILKDSSARSLYGEEGLPGVIIIKSKGGKGVKYINPEELPSNKIEGKATASLSLGGLNFKTDPESSSKSMKRFTDSLSKPLYIIDGKEVAETDFKLLNQNDIESVTVLKDKTMKSAYGERGKNGVIIVRTKKSKIAPKKN